MWHFLLLSLLFIWLQSYCPPCCPLRHEPQVLAYVINLPAMSFSQIFMEVAPSHFSQVFTQMIPFQPDLPYLPYLNFQMLPSPAFHITLFLLSTWHTLYFTYLSYLLLCSPTRIWTLWFWLVCSLLQYLEHSRCLINIC